MDPIYIMAMLGTVVFALSGAMAAARKGLDIFGFFIVAFAPAVGGGTLRDLLLGAGAVFWIEDLSYIYITAAVAVIAFFQVHRLEGKRQTLLIWADALGLSLFTIMGAQKAMDFGAPAVIVIVMGMVTGTFGGMVRDVICNELPLLLRQEIYALAAIAGATVYWGLVTLGISEQVAMLWSATATLGVRGPAIIFGWSLPPYQPRS